MPCSISATSDSATFWQWSSAIEARKPLTRLPFGLAHPDIVTIGRHLRSVRNAPAQQGWGCMVDRPDTHSEVRQATA